MSLGEIIGIVIVLSLATSGAICAVSWIAAKMADKRLKTTIIMRRIEAFHMSSEYPRCLDPVECPICGGKLLESFDDDRGYKVWCDRCGMTTDFVQFDSDVEESIKVAARKILLD